MKERMLTSDEGDIYYWLKGSGKTCIVFTHGMTMDHTLFLEQVECFSKNYTIILWDVPLHGKSKPYEGFCYENISKNLKQLIEVERFNSVHLVGQSMGGYINQAFAIRYPEMVLSLTFLDTTPFGKSYYTKMERYMGLKMGKLTWLYPSKSLIKAIAKSSCYTKKAEQQALETLKQTTKKEIIVMMDKVYGELFNIKESNHFDMPTQIIYGEFDKTGMVVKYSQNWAKKENYPLHVIKDAGHNSNVDNPKAFNKLLITFLESLKL